MDQVKVELLVLLEDIRMMLSAIDAIKDEIKDFHGRLCAIEERKKMEK